MNSKILENLKLKLLEVNDNKKVMLLALLLHNITIGARWIYSEPFSMSDKAEKLYCLSEIQHKISGFMLKARASKISSNEINFDDLFEVIMDKAQRANCQNVIANAIEHTFSTNDFD